MGVLCMCVSVLRVAGACFMCVSGSWVCHVFVRMFNVLCMFPVATSSIQNISCF